MDSRLLNKLTREDFDAEQYVNAIASEGTESTSDELLETRRRIQELADSTARELKKSVYANYQQFIDTAKEISILEGEMYQLNHMLTEQKNIMTCMMETSIASKKAELPKESPDDDDSRKNLAFLIEKVEGCSHVIEVPGRHLVHDGDVVELDAESFVRLQNCHMFLLNDSLMLTSWLPNRRGPMRYKYQALYELDSLAVVNAKDIGPIKNAFKVLMFPDTRVYQTDNPKAKRQWLDILEEAKKKKAARDKARRGGDTAASEAAAPAPSPAYQALPGSRPPASGVKLSNPFDDEEEDSQSEPGEQRSSLNPFDVAGNLERYYEVDWLQELPEDLDVLIAQRDFEGAVDRIEKANQALTQSQKSAPQLREHRTRIDHRVKQLTDILVKELQCPPERTLRGGPTASRNAVAQLIRLGKSAQASQLFLQSRSMLIKYKLRQLKIEGATSLYIRRICEAFFGTLRETCREFLKVFPDHRGCFSGFVVWARRELTAFSELFGRQVFSSNASMSTVADCVQSARTACSQLSSSGLELTFLFNSLVSADVEKTIIEGKVPFLEALRHRALEDQWTPSSFENKTQMNAFLDKMINMGFQDIENYVYDDVWLSLTNTSVQFCRLLLAFLDDLLKLAQPSVQRIVDGCIREAWAIQLEHIEVSLHSVKFIKQNKFILSNSQWLEEKVLPRTEMKYIDVVGYDSQELKYVRRTFGKLKSLVMAIQADLV